MKYTILFLLFPVFFSCKSKKCLVKNETPTKDTIYIENPKTGVLTMKIVEKVANPDGDWKLVNVSNQHSDEMARLTLSINSKKNEFNGYDGCNTYFGSLGSKTGTAIGFNDLSKTERACMVPAKYASIYYKQLELATSYEASGNFLILKDEDGKMLLRFEKKE